MFDDLFTTTGFSVDRCRAFLAIAEAGGITQAASGDPNRQSQLSRQLGELETWLGAKLVIRGRGRFALTDAGSDFLSLLKTCFSDLARLKASCSGQEPLIRVGAGESLLQWLVVPAVALLPHAFTNWKWHFQNLRSEKIIGCLLDGSLEFGLLRTQQVPKQLRVIEVTRLDHVLIIPEAFTAKSKQPGFTMRIAKLEDGSHLDAIQAEIAAETRQLVSMQCTSLAQVAEAVRLGLAAAVLPHFVKIHSVAAHRIVPVRGSHAPISLWLAWHPRTEALTPQFAKFRRVFQLALKSASRAKGNSSSGPA